MRLDLLYRHAADMDIEVAFDDLGPYRRGVYHHDLGLIVLSPRITRAQATATLAHEIGHHIHGDRHAGHQPHEDRADRTGASLIITPDDYADAEAEVGHHPGALAAALGVTRRIVLAWRDWYHLTGGVLHGLGRTAA